MNKHQAQANSPTHPIPSALAFEKSSVDPQMAARVKVVSPPGISNSPSAVRCERGSTPDLINIATATSKSTCSEDNVPAIN